MNVSRPLGKSSYVRLVVVLLRFTFASNRSKALRNEAHASKPKCGRAKQSYDPARRLQFWLNQVSLTDELLSIRKQVNNV